MTDLRDFHETATYIKALNEYFHGIQKRFDEAQTLGEKLDLLVVSKEIISTARRQIVQCHVYLANRVRKNVSGPHKNSERQTRCIR